MDNLTTGSSIPDFPPGPSGEHRYNLTSEEIKVKVPSQRKKGVFWTFLSLIGLFLLKFKSLLIFLKFAKFGITSLTMAVTIWVYALFYGWAFGAGIVILIFLHEMGHALAIRMKGIRAGAPVFIPFVGAFITMKELPKDVKVESFIAYGGPLAGGLASTISYWLFKEWGNPLFLVLAYVGFLMNLFNLIPFSPLDGGRIVAAVSTKIWGAGLLFILLFFLKTHNPILMMILVFGGLQIWNRRNKKDTDGAYYEVESSYRLNMGLSYVGILLYLGYMTLLTLNMLNQNGVRSGLGI